MKTAMFVMLAAFLLARPAAAELQFPEYEQQSRGDQAAWGYKITRTQGRNPAFSVTLPSAVAAKCSGARLTIRSRKNRPLAQFDVTPIRHKDGSLSFTVALYEELDGQAELIVYTDAVEGAAPVSDFGGFTFKSRVEKP